ncbi:MAG: hypothetical protein ACLQPV_05740 [Vulcanimicrobiaceae bacterium]
MSEPTIWWILIVSGIVTALAGLPAALAPSLLLPFAFGDDRPSPATVFFCRHWGLLIFLVGALVFQSAYVPATRGPILLAAAIEKLAIGALVFFGPLKRTMPMTVIAIGDGIFAILYIVYLAGW